MTAARGATILSPVRLPVRAALGVLLATGLSLALGAVLSAAAHAGPLPGLPPLRHFFAEGWVRDDGVTFEPTRGRWEVVKVDPVVPVSGELARFEEWRWFVAEDGLRSRAADRAEDWLRLGELELGSRRIEASKQLGGRFRISSFTGYQASSQRMIRAEYEMGRGLVIRSEARERGESRIVVEREQTFR